MPRYAVRPTPAAALAMAIGLVGCFGGGGGGRGDMAGERRAALAHLVVDNRTAEPLAIAFLYAAQPGGPSGEIGVGTVGAGRKAEVAPVPADEPIILIARGERSERRLEPRTLAIDEVWTWVIRPTDPASGPSSASER